MLFQGKNLRGLLRLSLVSLLRLAVCLAGLLLVHGQVFAQETASVQTVEPHSIVQASDVPETSDIRVEALVLVDTSGALTVDQIRARFEAGEGQPVDA